MYFKGRERILASWSLISCQKGLKAECKWGAWHLWFASYSMWEKFQHSCSCLKSSRAIPSYKIMKPSTFTAIPPLSDNTIRLHFFFSFYCDFQKEKKKKKQFKALLHCNNAAIRAPGPLPYALLRLTGLPFVDYSRMAVAHLTLSRGHLRFRWPDQSCFCLYEQCTLAQKLSIMLHDVIIVGFRSSNESLGCI